MSRKRARGSAYPSVGPVQVRICGRVAQMALTRARCSASFKELIRSVRQDVDPRWTSGSSESAISSRPKVPHRRIGTGAAGWPLARRGGQMCALEEKSPLIDRRSRRARRVKAKVYIRFLHGSISPPSLLRGRKERFRGRKEKPHLHSISPFLRKSPTGGENGGENECRVGFFSFLHPFLLRGGVSEPSEAGKLPP